MTNNFMNQDFIKQSFDMIKNNVNNYCQNINLLQEQNEKITKMLLEQGQNMNEEGKKFVEQWFETIKKNQQEYNKNMSDQLEKLQEFIAKSSQ